MKSDDPQPAQTVPLLEYLDKLEATANAANERTHGSLSAMPHGKIDDEMGPWGAGWTDSIQGHILATQPRATLALIAKLRDAVRLAVKLSLEFPVKPGLQVEIDRLEYIEVPL